MQCNLNQLGTHTIGGKFLTNNDFSILYSHPEFSLQRVPYPTFNTLFTQQNRTNTLRKRTQEAHQMQAPNKKSSAYPCPPRHSWNARNDTDLRKAMDIKRMHSSQSGWRLTKLTTRARASDFSNDKATPQFGFNVTGKTRNVVGTTLPLHTSSCISLLAMPLESTKTNANGRASARGSTNST